MDAIASARVCLESSIVTNVKTPSKLKPESGDIAIAAIAYLFSKKQEAFCKSARSGATAMEVRLRF